MKLELRHNNSYKELNDNFFMSLNIVSYRCHECHSAKDGSGRPYDPVAKKKALEKLDEFDSRSPFNRSVVDYAKEECFNCDHNSPTLAICLKPFITHFDGDAIFS